MALAASFGATVTQLAAAVLDRAVLDLVVLALGVELDARADADIVGDVGLADGVGQRLRIGRAGALVGVGRDQQRLERDRRDWCSG